MWKLTIKRELVDGPWKATMPFHGSEIVFAHFRHELAELDREEFRVVMLDGKGRPSGWNLVSIGSLTATVVHPREVFTAAILMKAAQIILIHNHPSGDPEPSAEDRTITARLRECGTLLGIQVIDHIIFGYDKYFSFADESIL